MSSDNYLVRLEKNQMQYQAFIESLEEEWDSLARSLTGFSD